MSQELSFVIILQIEGSFYCQKQTLQMVLHLPYSEMVVQTESWQVLSKFIINGLLSLKEVKSTRELVFDISGDYVLFFYSSGLNRLLFFS